MLPNAMPKCGIKYTTIEMWLTIRYLIETVEYGNTKNWITQRLCSALKEIINKN